MAPIVPAGADAVENETETKLSLGGHVMVLSISPEDHVFCAMIEPVGGETTECCSIQFENCQCAAPLCDPGCVQKA
jgi:hypothetical protein